MTVRRMVRGFLGVTAHFLMATYLVGPDGKPYAGCRVFRIRSGAKLIFFGSILAELDDFDKGMIADV